MMEDVSRQLKFKRRSKECIATPLTIGYFVAGSSKKLKSTSRLLAKVYEVVRAKKV